MGISALKLDSDAVDVQTTDLALHIVLADGRELDAPLEWSGTLDTMSIGEDGTSANIAVSAESKAVDLLRGTPWFYTDEDQKLVNATDRAFKFVTDQVDKPIIWPAREYYYQ